ncbi:hypothetical protein B5D77_06285 [Microcystis sp. MC19]|nr:hypothetical protein B5D77_06285 [Microcystis sp. MC19]
MGFSCPYIRESIAAQILMTISFIVYLLALRETQTFRFLLVLRGTVIAIADKKRVNPVHPRQLFTKKA